MTAGNQNSPVFDFTSLDYESVKNNLIEYAQRIYSGELWTDFNDSNFATFLLQQQAYVSDLLFYNSNAAVLECIPLTLIREQSFRDICKTFGYTMKSATPSMSDVLRIYQLAVPPTYYPLTISKRFEFTTEEDIVFHPTADFSFSLPLFDVTDGYYVEIPVVQGIHHDGSAEGYPSDGERIGVSNGSPGQKFSLRSSPMIDNTLSVTVNSTAYTLITNFIEAGATDKACILETDENLVTYVIFGDGINGVIPPNGHTIRATYDTGGGTETNYPVNTRLSVSGVPNESLPPAILHGSARAKLITPAVDGGPRQSLANAKLGFALSQKANDRAVVDSDYAALALGVLGVLRAFAIPGRPVGGTTPVLLFIVPTDGSIPTINLANQVITHLKNYRMSGKRIYIQDPVYVNVIIDADVYVLAKTSRTSTAQRVKAMLLDRFSLDNVDFASAFILQDIYKDTTGAQLDGVSSIFYRKFSIKPYSGRYVKTHTTGNGIATNISVDWRIVKRREWFIKILHPDPINGVLCNRFLVKQRAPGNVSFVTSSVVTDEVEAFSMNEFIGWYFYPLPEDLDEGYKREIVGNTGQNITVRTTDLLTIVQPGDPYVVEKEEVATGKVLRTQTNASVTNSVLVPVVDSLNFVIGDKIYLADSSGAAYTRTVAALPNTILFSGGSYAAGALNDILTIEIIIGTNSTSISIDFKTTLGTQQDYINTLNTGLSGYAIAAAEGANIRIALDQTGGNASGSVTAVGGMLEDHLGVTVGMTFTHYLQIDTNVTLLTSAYVDSLWTSADGSVSFSVIEGTNEFVFGDVMYVDTYPQTSDIRMRSENFPLIIQDDVRINTIGGM